MAELEELCRTIEGELAQSKEANAGLMRSCDKLESEIADAKETIEMLEIRHRATMLCHQAQMDEITKQRDHYKAACDQYSEDEMLCKLAEVTKQRDALAKALKSLCRAIISEEPHGITGLLKRSEAFLSATKGESHATLQR